MRRISRTSRADSAFTSICREAASQGLGVTVHAGEFGNERNLARDRRARSIANWARPRRRAKPQPAEPPGPRPHPHRSLPHVKPAPEPGSKRRLTPCARLHRRRHARVVQHGQSVEMAYRPSARGAACHRHPPMPRNRDTAIAGASDELRLPPRPIAATSSAQAIEAPRENAAICDRSRPWASAKQNRQICASEALIISELKAARFGVPGETGSEGGYSP